MSDGNSDTRIRCWSCGAQRDLVNLLDTASEIVYQPVCDSFTVACPDCGRKIWLDFNTNSVSVGEMIGFGARPDVEYYQLLRLDTPVEVDFSEHTITYSGKVWRYR